MAESTKNVRSGGRLPQLLQNVLSNWSGVSINMAIAFFLSPFVIHHLGASAYGVWVLIVSITGYLGLLDLGVRGTVTYYVAKLHAQSKHEEASRLVSSALLIFSSLGAVAFAVALIVAPFASRLLHIPDDLKPHFPLLLMIAGASVAATLIAGVFGATVFGLQRFDLLNSIEIGGGLLRASAIVLSLKYGKGLIALAIIQLVSSVGTGVLYFFTSSVLYPQLKIRYRLSDRTNARLIVSFGSYLFLLNISGYVILNTDSLVISSFLPVSMVAFFGIAANLITNSRQLLSGISSTVSPFASALEAQGNLEKIRRVALSGPRYVTMLMLPIVLTFVFRGRTFISLWIGSDYAGLSGTVLQILCIALFFGAANQIATSMTVGINKHRPVVKVAIAEALVNLALSIALVRVIGIYGVAWGTAIPSVLTSLLFWPRYLHRIFGVGSFEYILSTWLRPAATAVPFAIVTILVDHHWHPPNVWFFFLQVALTLPVSLVASWFGCLSSSERRAWSARIYSQLRVADSARPASRP
jgi:O-antigen/teichoic acid export membrane protein